MFRELASSAVDETDISNLNADSEQRKLKKALRFIVEEKTGGNDISSYEAAIGRLRVFGSFNELQKNIDFDNADITLAEIAHYPIALLTQFLMRAGYLDAGRKEGIKTPCIALGPLTFGERNKKQRILHELEHAADDIIHPISESEILTMVSNHRKMDFALSLFVMNLANAFMNFENQQMLLNFMVASTASALLAGVYEVRYHNSDHERRARRRANSL